MGSLRTPRAIQILLACVVIAFCFVALCRNPAHADNPWLFSPEGSSVCSRDEQCPYPALSGGQVRECIRPRCVRGECVHEFLTGKYLGKYKLPSALSCFEEPVVCDNAGNETTLSDPTKRVAAHEDEMCIPSQPIANPCLAPRCRNKECVPVAYPNENNVECPSPNPAAGPCEKGLCRDGQCQPFSDAAKEGVSCLPEETNVCRTTKHLCSSTGSCDPKTTIEDGKECSPDPDGGGPERILLGPPSSLPPSFLSLFTNAAKPPSYTCRESDCKLEYCGDGVVNLPDEECDGSQFRDGLDPKIGCDVKTCRANDSATIAFSPAPMTYGELLADQQLNASVSTSRGQALSEGTITYTSASVPSYQRGTRPNAGQHPVTASWAPSAQLLGRYKSVSTVGTLVVRPKSITCSARSYRKKKQDANPAFAFSCEGLVEGDTIAQLGGAVGLEPGTTANVEGTFAIVFTSKPSSPNYDISLVNGTLTVEGDCNSCRIVDGKVTASAWTWRDSSLPPVRIKGPIAYCPSGGGCGGSPVPCVTIQHLSCEGTFSWLPDPQAPNSCQEVTVRVSSDQRSATILVQYYHFFKLTPSTLPTCGELRCSLGGTQVSQSCGEACGNNRIDGEEECDGPARKAGSPDGATCNQATCKLVLM
jgi:hypothetical protein